MTLLFLTAGMCFLAWICRASLLLKVADVWIVSDSIGPADAVAVLGGGLEIRPFAAADFYRRGLVRKVLVARVGADSSLNPSALPPHTALNRDALIKFGVPESAIEIFGTELSSTSDEATALREWVIRNHAGRIIIPTEIFSSRRVRWVMNRTLAGADAQVQVAALEPREYTRANWWRHKHGLIAFHAELLKYIYYRISL